MIFFNLIIPFLFSIFLIHHIRLLSLNYNIFIDYPKKRGQHFISIPRSGGICFFLSFILFFISNHAFEKNIPFYFLILFITYPILNFLIGLYDDYKNLNFKIKLFFQVISSIITTIIIKIFFDFDNINFFTYILLIFFFSIAFININNFMDGTDAIVITNFMFFLVICILYSFFFGHVEILSFLIWSLITSLVFLFYNFPPSKIFLGDSGSYFLGSIVVLIVCYFALFNLKFFLIFLNMYSFFIIDTSLTLFYRFKNKENIFLPHNKHLYQQFSSINKKSFSINYIIYMTVNLFFVWLMVYYNTIVIFTFLNYIFLALIYYIFKKDEITQ